MLCTENATTRHGSARRRAARFAAAAWIAAFALAGCGTGTNPPPGPASAAASTVAPSVSPSVATTAPATAAQPASPATASAPRIVRLPPPGPVRSAEELKLQAAHRMVSANPDTSYLGLPPEPLLGIPVLEIELNADGSVRRIKVIREPREAKHTIQLAIDIVRSAAPYGDVSRLPKPWKFVEVFLFDDDLHFKPASLDR